jgi:hypothetical protein
MLGDTDARRAALERELLEALANFRNPRETSQRSGLLI